MPYFQIANILTFLFNELLFCNESVASLVGSAFSDKQILPLVSHLVSTLLLVMPKTESELASFQKPLEKCCRDFETKLGTLGTFGTQILGSESPLLGVINDLGSKFGDARRRDILLRARQVLLADYHNTMLGTGDALEDDPASAVIISLQKYLFPNTITYPNKLYRFHRALPATLER
jgi:hypothetical protein